MKFRILTILLLIGLLAYSASAQDKVSTTAAAILTSSTSASGAALGNANVALARGQDALFWNPSGLVQNGKSSAMFNVVNWFVGTQIQEAAVILDQGNRGAFGMRVTVLNSGEMDVNTIDRPYGTGERFSTTTMIAGLSYSRYLTTQFSFGATFKYINERIWNSTATGLAVDLGVLYKSDIKNLRIGMSITNYGTDMKMEGDDLKQAHDIDPNNNGNNDLLPAYMETNSWPLPLNFRVGLAMDVVEMAGNRITGVIDAKHPSDNAESLDIGAEYSFREMLYLRGGYRNLFTSQKEDSGVSLGFGLDINITSINSISLNYTYMVHEVLNDPQMWSLGISF